MVKIINKWKGKIWKKQNKHDLEIIKHYFFSEYNQYGSTAYRIFLNERLKQALEKMKM